VSYERPPPPTRREGHLDHRSSPVPEPCIPDVHDYRGNVWVVPGRRLWVQVPPIVVQRCHARRERALVLGKEAGAPRDEASHRLPRGSDELSSSVSCAECVSASLRLCRGVPHPGASQSPFREGFVDTNGQFTSVTIPGTFGTEIAAKLANWRKCRLNSVGSYNACTMFTARSALEPSGDTAGIIARPRYRSPPRTRRCGRAGVTTEPRLPGYLYGSVMSRAADRVDWQFT
jgi:hypothetical protein